MSEEFKAQDRVRLARPAAGYKPGACGTVLRVNRHPRSQAVISYFVQIDGHRKHATFYPAELEPASQ
jgi:hypothetical protein